MKYCNFCGMKMLDHEELCRVCGKHQNDEAEEIVFPADECTEAIDKALYCPYCRNEIFEADEIYLCQHCQTPHHKQCWEEKHECSVFSCYSKRHEDTSVGDADYPGLMKKIRASIDKNRKKYLVAIAAVLAACFLSFAVIGGWYFINRDPLHIMKKFFGDKTAVTALSLSGNGDKIAAGMSDGSFELWNTTRETRLSRVEAFNQPLDFVLFSPGESGQVAVGGDAGGIKFYASRNSAAISSIKSGNERIRAAGYFGSGKTIAAGNQAGDVFAIDIQQNIPSLMKKAHQGPVLALRVDSKANIVSIGSDKKISLMDSVAGTTAGELAVAVEPQVFALSSDGSFAVAADAKGRLALADIKLSKTILNSTVPNGVAALAVRKDGTVFAAGKDGFVSVITAAGGAKRQFLAGKAGSIAVLLLDSAEKKLYTGGKGMLIKQWDVSTGRCQKTFMRQQNWVDSFAVSKDGQLVAIAQKDGEIKIFDADSGEVVETLYGHNEPVRAMAFSADGKKLVSGGHDKLVKVWDVASGSSKDLRGHKGWVQSVAFSPDGKVVASGSFDSTVKVWDADTGEQMHDLTGHDAWVRDVAFSPDGKRLATCGDDKKIKIWNVASGECEKTLTGHERWVNDVYYSEDGKQLISSSGDGTEKTWGMDTGKCLSTIQEQNDLRNAMIYAADGKMFAEKIECPFCDEEIRPGDVIAICDYCKTPQHIACWRENGSKCVACGKNIYKPHEIGVDFDKMYNSQRSRGLFGKFFENNLGSGRSVFDNVKVLAFSALILLLILVAVAYYLVREPRMRTIIAHNYWIEALKFSPDGKYLASGSGDGMVKVWSARSGSFIRTLKAGNFPIETLTFLFDGKKIVTAGWEKLLRLWDIETGKECGIYTGHHQMVYSLAATRNNESLVSSAGDNSIRIWDAATFECKKIIRGHISSVYGIAVSSDGSKIASCSNDRTVKVWDFEGNLIIAMAGHDGAVRTVDFHPGGFLLASGSDEGDVVIWNQKTGERVKTLNGHSKRIRAVAFSHNGNMLASASDDHLVIVWDIRSGSQIEVLKGHTDRVCTVAFSPDDNRVASAGDDRTIKIWRLRRRRRY